MKLVYTKKQTSHFHFPLVASTLALWSITGCVPTATARKSPNKFLVRNLLHVWQEAPYGILFMIFSHSSTLTRILHLRRIFTHTQKN